MLFTSIRVGQRVSSWHSTATSRNIQLNDIWTHVQPRRNGYSTINGVPCARPVRSMVKPGLKHFDSKLTARCRYRTPNLFSSSNYCTHRHHPFAMSSTVTPSLAVDNEQYRLPTDLKPAHYDVTVKTDLENLTFQGIVKI